MASAYRSPIADCLVTGLTADSRQVRPGYLFAALPGNRVDGRVFIPQAIAGGAVAVLAPAGTRLPDGSGDVILIEDPEPRRRLARLAARFHRAQPAVIAAVTGTNGKTSTVHFARLLWQALGYPAAGIGTLGLVTADYHRSGGMTTPDPVQLHADLAALASGGVQHLAIEASSHGLDQFRLDGVRVRAAGFTNLTRDHLDYHVDMAAYLAAKTRLFSELLPPNAAAVINLDDAAGAGLVALCRAGQRRTITYGAAEGADLHILELRAEAEGLALRLGIFGHEHVMRLPLAGRFQAHNVLCALGMVLADLDDVAAALPVLIDACGRLEGVPGRMQRVAVHPCGAPVFVDYAHTPDALETVLAALRPHTARRLVVVFGCGGDRDTGKRPLMGAIAGRLADRVIVTDDNPRSEAPAFIRAAILAAVPGAEEVGDRARAIETAVAGLASGDVLVIAGKGHERGQVIGNEVRPFDDAAVAAAVVAEVRL